MMQIYLAIGFLLFLVIVWLYLRWSANEPTETETLDEVEESEEQSDFMIIDNTD